MARHTLARSMHDLGLAAWFGGALMGSVGVNGAAASLRDPSERSAAATVGWSRWAPISAVAIGAHLAGSVQLLRTEGYRVRHQDGVARSSAVKAGLTAAALGTTAYSGVLNRKMAAAGHVPVQGATEPGPATPRDVAKAQKQLKAVQWLIPGLTGGIVAVTAWQSEQMRPKQMLAGLLPSVSSRYALPAAGALGAALLGQRALRHGGHSGRRDRQPARLGAGDQDAGRHRPARRRPRGRRRDPRRDRVHGRPPDGLTPGLDQERACGSRVVPGRPPIRRPRRSS